jgi:cytochrome c oxidase subunit 4
MVSTRFYAAIYVVLFVFATLQVAVEEFGFLEQDYWLAFWAIMVLSLIKALFVAGYYQHLRMEPRSVTALIASAMLVVLALTGAAAYSIT